MPGLPFTQLPTSGSDSPYGIVEQNYQGIQKNLQGQYQRDASVLEKQYLTDADFKNKLSTLRTKYQTNLNQYRIRGQQQVRELQTIQRLMNQGAIDQQAGQRAMWRLVLPAEAERAMFPGQPSARPFSPGQLGAYKKMMGEFAVAGKKEIRWGPNWSQESLIKQYIGARQQAGYDDPSWTATQRRQFDVEWDDLMLGEKEFQWDPKVPEIRGLRAAGKLQEAVAKQITPLAASVAKAKTPGRPMRGWFEYGAQIRRPVTKKLTRKQAMDIFYEAGGDKNQARQLAKQRGFEF